MSLQELNGWSPASVTVDAQGVVLSVTVSEPRFTPADKAALLLSRRADHEPRGRHGLPLSVAMDPNNQFAFDVPAPSTDWAQATLNAAQDRFHTAWPDADMDSLLWSVRLREDADHNSDHASETD